MITRKIVIALFALTAEVLGQSPIQLTMDQKVKDFQYLCDVLEDNYCFFGSNNRANGIDWLSNKEAYLQKIKQTNSDSAYIFSLESIVQDLNSGHVGFSPTVFYNGYYQAYKRLSNDYPKYHRWLDVLKRSKKHECKTNFNMAVTDGHIDSSLFSFMDFGYLGHWQSNARFCL